MMSTGARQAHRLQLAIFLLRMDWNGPLYAASQRIRVSGDDIRVGLGSGWRVIDISLDMYKYHLSRRYSYGYRYSVLSLTVMVQLMFA